MFGSLSSFCFVFCFVFALKICFPGHTHHFTKTREYDTLESRITNEIFTSMVFMALSGIQK